MPPNPLTSWLIAQLEVATRRAEELAELAQSPPPSIPVSVSVEGKGGSMSDFTCPFCSAASHKPNDADRRYCGQCRVFVDDAIARRDELGACRGHATISVQTTEQLEQCEACGFEVRSTLLHGSNRYQKKVELLDKKVYSIPASEPAAFGLNRRVLAKRLKASTIGRRAAAIAYAYAHKLAGFEAPTSIESVRAVVRGIRRSIGTAPARKLPATADVIGEMLKHCRPDILRGLRDAALASQWRPAVPSWSH